ncbi:hypothetical protein BZM27_06250 [Paraburkholderia steynii]|uniref:Integrase catalytic domain-containing protein n=1 Tax=Paraburkholderia steynii TaxID=1245441 RepID=A0A4R0XG17_9BURK|nr:hypothetical protein BZM27_06250 [Paraburkholderia steynii]
MTTEKAMITQVIEPERLSQRQIWHGRGAYPKRAHIVSLDEARKRIEAWSTDYNSARPHLMLSPLDRGTG